MPNWCEGNLRLRGTRDAILNFIENEIKCTGYRDFTAGPEVEPAEVELSRGGVIVKKPESMQDAAFCSLYINGTHRNFIYSEIDLYLGGEDGELITVCIDDVAAAWRFDPEPYLEKARKYGLDIRIVGFESGMQFVQNIEIIDGMIVTCSEMKYDDWMWECLMPNMGG